MQYLKLSRLCTIQNIFTIFFFYISSPLNYFPESGGRTCTSVLHVITYYLILSIECTNDCRQQNLFWFDRPIYSVFYHFPVLWDDLFPWRFLVYADNTDQDLSFKPFVDDWNAVIITPWCEKCPNIFMLISRTSPVQSRRCTF